MTAGKTMALIRYTFVGKVMSLVCNILSGLVIAFIPRSKCLLISWLQSPSAVILEPKKRKSVTVEFHHIDFGRIANIQSAIGRYACQRSKESRKTISKVKTQPSEWDKMIANEATDK